ncbi:hypothetical protein NMY22_g12411 [Coprinellus aureogranulatus]|nr:hypothetical protein NMY22_g12411 [Coprinellus aureogranulatus]
MAGQGNTTSRTQGSLTTPLPRNYTVPYQSYALGSANAYEFGRSEPWNCLTRMPPLSLHVSVALDGRKGQPHVFWDQASGNLEIRHPDLVFDRPIKRGPVTPKEGVMPSEDMEAHMLVERVAGLSYTLGSKVLPEAPERPISEADIAGGPTVTTRLPAYGPVFSADVQCPKYWLQKAPRNRPGSRLGYWCEMYKNGHIAA